MKSVRQRTVVDAEKRAKCIRDIRLHLTPGAGGYVSQEQFGALVAEAVGLTSPFAASSVSRWESGSEPGLVAGCGIAILGGITAEELALVPEPATFRVRVAGENQPATDRLAASAGDIAAVAGREIAAEKAAKDVKPNAAPPSGRRPHRKSG